MNTKNLTYLSITAGILYYVVVLILGEVPQDEGDGLQHFAISQESWSDPALFLDHWGKPLFILLSSTFAQLGFYGYVCFNILVFLLTGLLARNVLTHFNVSETVIAFFPWILVSIPDYSNCIIGGMTEPLFGLLLLSMFWSAINQRWFLFAIIASFTPFARSEGMLVVIVAVPYLLLFRQWRPIVFLTFGFAIYALAGWLLIHEPMWYFKNNPYPEISIYGSGPWYAYILSALDHLGIVAVLLIPVSVVSWWLLLREKPFNHRFLFHLLFFGGIYLGIIVIHSYLWAKGLRGALGLSRIATLGVVPLITLLLIGLNYFLEHGKMNRWLRLGILVCCCLLLAKETFELKLPTEANPHQQALKEASDYLRHHENEVGTIYYFHPLVAFFQGKTTLHKDSKYRQRFVYIEKDVNEVFKPGDLIVRDSKFGAFDQGLPFEKLEKYPWIVPVKRFYTTDFFTELNGEQKSVIIYEVMDKQTFDRQKWDHNQKKIIRQIREKTYETPGKINLEYFNLDTNFVLPQLTGPKQEFVAGVSLTIEGNETVYLIFDNGSGYYLSIPIKTETKEIVMSFVTGKIDGLLFIHNPSMKPYQLRITPKYWQQSLDPGIKPVK